MADRIFYAFMYAIRFFVAGKYAPNTGFLYECYFFIIENAVAFDQNKRVSSLESSNKYLFYEGSSVNGGVSSNAFYFVPSSVCRITLRFVFSSTSYCICTDKKSSNVNVGQIYSIFLR